MVSFFFFNDTATTEIYTLSLHDALPICSGCTTPMNDTSFTSCATSCCHEIAVLNLRGRLENSRLDRKSTRLNSSHANISYAVFCLKKKLIFARAAELVYHVAVEGVLSDV